MAKEHWLRIASLQSRPGYARTVTALLARHRAEVLELGLRVVAGDQEQATR
jgi:hypothetical protein